MKNFTRARETNRANWEDRAVAHGRDRTGFYRVADFKAGFDTLLPIESGEIGDVTGIRILHMQCHLGLDTLSLARRGAEVTGIDFSHNAIAFARNLSSETNIPAMFVETDVYDVRKSVAGHFDMVFATWGVLCWVPDVGRWMKVAASMLAPGGKLYLADGHPLVEEAQEVTLADGTRRIALGGGWKAESVEEIQEQSRSYTGDHIEHAVSHQWTHSLSETISGVTDAGLTLSFLHESDLLSWKRFESMEAVGNGLYRLPSTIPSPPLSFSLMAIL